jgi:hypothetical protein
MNIMDRETILKHSKSIRLNHTLLPDFNDVISDFAEKRNKTELLEKVLQIIQTPFGQEVIYRVLELYEKEYHIIILSNLKNNQIIDIW